MITDPATLLPVALRAADTAAQMMRTRRPDSVTEKRDRDVVSDVEIAIEPGGGRARGRSGQRAGAGR
jgi:hypothetical protein